jgi:hypothetical protein
MPNQPGPNIDPRFVTVATRLRSLRTELDRLDDAIELLDRDDRPRLGHPSAILRDILDMIEEDVEARATGR